MQLISSKLNGRPNQPAANLTGRQLHRLALDLTPTERALLGAELVTGATQVSKLTPAQACLLSRASRGYLSTAGHTTTAQKAGIHCGTVRLSAIHNAQRNTDHALDRLVRKFGSERVLNALVRLEAAE
jgi:hypothetical protein